MTLQTNRISLYRIGQRVSIGVFILTVLFAIFQIAVFYSGDLGLILLVIKGVSVFLVGALILYAVFTIAEKQKEPNL
jgi:hypothetical protein